MRILMSYYVNVGKYSYYEENTPSWRIILIKFHLLIFIDEVLLNEYRLQIEKTNSFVNRFIIRWYFSICIYFFTFSNQMFLFVLDFIIAAVKSQHHSFSHVFGEFYCPNNCGRKYKYKYSLHNHLKYECGVEKKFKCSECGRAFTQKGNLKTHLITVHKKIFFEINP